ncbi:MAG: hypothetical protein GXX85_03435 [Ignavibacteria bacterium]|nr:hypothetical protein [Ignavibacteria bacterium]
MKNKKTFFTTAIASLILLLTSSCDVVDKFDTIDLNIPMSIDIITIGTETTLTESDTFCLTEFDLYNDNKDKMEEISFVEASYRTTAVSPANLSGNISVELKTEAGLPLFSITIPNDTPAALLNNPIKLALTADQINALNSYVSNLSNQCFEATVSISNMPGGEKTVTGVVDILFKSKIEM